MYVLYTDNSLLACPRQRDIDACIEDIKRAGLQFTIEGDLGDFLGINIQRHKDGSLQFTQSHLIDQIIDALNLSNTNTCNIPAPSSTILKRNEHGKQFDGLFITHPSSVN